VRYLGHGDVTDLSSEGQREVLDDGRVWLVWVELLFLILKLCLGRRLYGGFGRLVVVRVDDHDGVVAGSVDLGGLRWLLGLRRGLFQRASASPKDAHARLVAV
jgi:hypothetical protein